MAHTSATLALLSVRFTSFVSRRFQHVFAFSRKHAILSYELKKIDKNLTRKTKNVQIHDLIPSFWPLVWCSDVLPSSKIYCKIYCTECEQKTKLAYYIRVHVFFIATLHLALLAFLYYANDYKFKLVSSHCLLLITQFSKRKKKKLFLLVQRKKKVTLLI